jgi:hypothetical protein
MRKLLMTMVLAALITLPVLGQFPGGRMMGGGNMLLGDKNVQKALKLTEEQIKELTKANTEMREGMKKAFEDKDRDAMKTVNETHTQSIEKIKKDFTKEQTARLLGIEAQVAEKNGMVAIFKNEEVAKVVKLSSKQKDMVSEMEKDVKEMMDDAKEDFKARFKAMAKVGQMGRETFAKITKDFSEDQKKAWEELKGEKVELEARPGFPGKGKDKKKDEF